MPYGKMRGTRSIEYLQELRQENGRLRASVQATGADFCPEPNATSLRGRQRGQWQRAMVSMFRKRTCILVSMSIPCQIFRKSSKVIPSYT